MARKAFDSQRPRQAVWDSIRRHPSRFDSTLLAREASVSKALVRSVLRSLSAAGIIEVVVAGAGTIRGEWMLIRDMGPDIPLLTPTGEASSQGARARNMWRTMRMLGDFDAEELARSSSVGDVHVSIRTAQEWITALSRAGYIVRIRKAAGGLTIHRRARYAMPGANWTGPLPPILRRNGIVFDQNLHRVAGSSGEGK